jgi:glutaminase
MFCLAVMMAGNSFAQTPEQYRKAVNEAYAGFKDLKEGKNANYIKELANVDSNLYSIAIITVDGRVFAAGDQQAQVSIQSVSKAFVLAQVLEESGPTTIREKVGVNATGLPFNSIIAMEINRGAEINSMVNAGAIATTSLVKGTTAAEKWKNIVMKMSEFAGRMLEMDQAVYISEAGDNQRNQAKAMLMNAYGHMYFDALQTVDVYTMQCALSVNVRDLATMAATLANGGYNPITKKVVVSPTTVAHTLPVMVSAGLYENSGVWLYNTGIPAKSGVGGAIVAVVPGKYGIAVISPPLDGAGNSVKAQRAIEYIVKTLDSNPFVITPKK